MTQSPSAPAKMDRLAAFVDAFTLRASVAAPAAAVQAPCLWITGSPHAGDSRIVLSLRGFDAPPAALRVAIEIDFDNATNPLMAAVPGEVSVLLRDAPALGLMAEVFLSEVEGKRCGRTVALNRLAEVMVLMMLRQVIDAGAGQAGLFAALAHPNLNRALVSMHDRPAQAWTVEDLAGCAAMSRTRFMATFHRVVGTTPMAYLRSWRLALACRQLQAGHPVKSVARHVGFDSAAAFSRAFSQTYGRPPSA